MENISSREDNVLRLSAFFTMDRDNPRDSAGIRQRPLIASAYHVAEGAQHLRLPSQSNQTTGNIVPPIPSDIELEEVPQSSLTGAMTSNEMPNDVIESSQADSPGPSSTASISLASNSWSSKIRAYMSRESLKTATMLAIFVSLIFGIGAWLGQQYGNSLASKNNDIALYALCADHEVRHVGCRVNFCLETDRQQDLRKLPRCQAIMNETQHSLEIERREVPSNNLVTDKDALMPYGGKLAVTDPESICPGSPPSFASMIRIWVVLLATLAELVAMQAIYFVRSRLRGSIETINTEVLIDMVEQFWRDHERFSERQRTHLIQESPQPSLPNQIPRIMRRLLSSQFNLNDTMMESVMQFGFDQENLVPRFRGYKVKVKQA